MKKGGVAVIIPAYNEEKTIKEVVKSAKTSVFVKDVIVVSDGSKDKTATRARSAGAKVLNLPIKRGKGTAMLHGLAHTDAEIILFLDADLIGLEPAHIKRLLDPVLRGNKIMTVGVRDRGMMLSKIGQLLPLIGGERAMQRFVIENIKDKYLKGYMIESSLNYYCRSRGFKYGGVFLRGLKIRRKMQKVGVLKGFFGYVNMVFQVIKAIILVRLAKLRGKF